MGKATSGPGDTLTSTEVGGPEELHTLVAGQQMRARPGRGLGCGPGDGDWAEALNEEASGVAGHQDASLEPPQQALGGLRGVGFGKLHLHYAALRVQALSHKPTVKAADPDLAHHASAVDEGEEQREVWGQESTVTPGAGGSRPVAAQRPSAQGARATQGCKKEKFC